MTRMKVAIYTIVSNNYLHFARTLLQSARSHHPDADLFCTIVDTDLEPARVHADEFEVITLQEIGIPDLESFTFKYTVLELNTAVKPWVMQTLLARGYDAVLYIDPDIVVYQPLAEVFALLGGEADIVITPHLLAPMSDDLKPTELDIRRAGTYNFGFCAARPAANTLAFLKWWQSKLLDDCIVDVDRGIFVDQSWIDLVPGMFEKVAVLRHPGYNVAYWNLAQRTVEQLPSGQWAVNGQPLVFFHFSGFNPMNPKPFSKHQNRFTLANMGPAAALATNYAQALINNGAQTSSKLPYGFATFSDGSRIPDAFRRFYLQDAALRTRVGLQPFGRAEALLWTARPSKLRDTPGITWAMYCVWHSRADLQKAFDLSGPTASVAYWQWFLAKGRTYVSDNVIAAHRQRWHQGAARLPAITAAEIAASAAHHTDPATGRGQVVFMHLLGREAGQRGLRYLRPLCASRFGASLAVLLVAATPESRSREHTLRRMRNALAGIWGRHAAADTTTAVATVAHADGPGQLAYSGIHPADTGSVAQGLWCGKSVTIPLPDGPHHRIVVRGECPVSLHQQASGDEPVVMAVFLDGALVHHQLLAVDGMFDITVGVPVAHASARTLRLDTGRTFVPQASGMSDDVRALSWRLHYAATDTCVMVDVTRPTPLLSVAKLRQASGFNLVGYLAAELGVGEAARSMAQAAHAAGIPYSIEDVGYQSTNRQSDRSAWSAAVEQDFDIQVVYVNADQTPRTLAHLATLNKRASAYRIGYWHWEQPRLPDAYLGSFEGLDEVWVPTAFVHAAVAAISPLPVFKVPHAISFAVDKSYSRESFGIPTHQFAVLVMYDFQSYRYRKNPEAAIAAFKLAAGHRNDACLIIKTINAELFNDDYAALKESVASLPSVRLISEFYSREQLYALEANCDCMISLHRAEGFGLGPAEMMYLGKPVIATGWSGNMEFMTPMNSLPVNYELRPLEKPVGVYEAGLDWAEPDIEHAASCLTKLLDDPGHCRDIGLRAQHTMQTRFSPKVIGQQYKERFTLIRAMRHLG